MLEGRIDQVLPDQEGKRLIFSEIKTLNHPLPADPGFLVQRYQRYVAQAAAYGILARQAKAYQGVEVQVQLCLVYPPIGTRQIIPVGLGDEGMVYQQLDALVQYAQQRYQRQERFYLTLLKQPFEAFRPQQATVLEQLDSSGVITTLEAPTGFGKTGLISYWALNQLKKGLYERVVFLSSKKTAHQTILNTLSRMVPPDGPMRVQSFESRQQHAITSVLHNCDPLGLLCQEGIDNLWQKAHIDLEALFENHFFCAEDAKKKAEQTGICPYAISRSALNFADIWVADYNYVFSPAHRSIFDQQIGFNPAQTLLIIDEAHHLPERVAQSLSTTHTYAAALQTQEELKLADDVPAELMLAWEEWSSFLRDLQPCDRLNESLSHHLFEQAQRLNEVITQALQTPILELPGETRLRLWQAADMLSFLMDQRFDQLLYCPEAGQLVCYCLDACKLIRSTVETYKKTVFMSATLKPWAEFIDRCGLKPAQVQHIIGDAPWQARAYDVAVDTRLDTRYRLRAEGYALTAETLAQLYQHADKTVIGFFPSYAYAQAVYDVLQATYCSLPCLLQDRYAHTQEEWLQEALDEKSLLLLILGSRFTESINILGNRISYALVAGPGLPRMSPVEEDTRSLFSHLGEKKSFQKVYQIPALRKVHQALGRLVRGPQEQVRVLLHCKRFADSDYSQLLDTAYKPQTTIQTPADLLNWLKHPPSHPIVR